MQFVMVDVAVLMQRQFQQLSVPDGPQIRSSTSLSSASEGVFCCICLQHFSASVHPDVEALVAGTPGV